MKYAWFGLAVILSGLLVWGSCGLTKHVIVAFDKWGDVAPTDTLAKINKALDTVNTPKSGTLSMLDDTILQGRLTIDATNKVLLHEQTQLGTLDGYARNLDAEVSGLATHADTTLDGVDRVAIGLTGTANAATVDLQTAQSSLASFQPLLAHADTTVGDLDARITAFAPVETNLTGITGNLNATTNDFQIKFHAFLFPEPCHTATCKWGKVFLVAHTASQFVEPAYFLQELIQGATR